MSDTGDDLRAQLVGFFFEESSEGLEIIEAGLVDLDLDAPDSETINSIFRAMHSIKGASGSFGFGDIANFAHHAETLLDEIRSGTRSLDQSIVDLLLKSTDCISEMVEAIQNESEMDAQRVESLAGELQAILNTGSQTSQDAGEAAAEPAAAPEVGPTGLVDWQITFVPHKGLLRTGNDPFRIIRELGTLGEIKVESDLSDLPHFEVLDPELCHLKWHVDLQAGCDRSAIEEVFAWVEDDCDLLIETATREDMTPEGNQVVEELPSSATDVAVAEVGGGRAPQKTSGKTSGKVGGSSIRVSTEKVDALINMVGELVITQSMLSEIGEKFEPEHLERLKDGLGELERNTRELQDTVMKIRMLPISVTFARFPRLVRDLSQSLGKSIELELRGESTELDKNVLEQIGDPLVHLVRNSLDHGLETPEQRREAGKPETGKITLAAYHEGGSIIIKVEDDGRGLDTERIRAKAIERGLITERESCDEQKISELIFSAGFSTANTVSDVSGRGVGMDVVQRNIKELGGTIALQSIPGQGTTTTIRLPLTLAILDGQLIRVGTQIYVIPLIGIIESLQIKARLVNSIAAMMEVYRLREEAVPILRLHQIFGLEPDTHILDGGLLVVVESNGGQVGLVVDELLNQQQVVIKSLEANYKRVRGISGATILGDGTVALIIDIMGLIEQGRDTGVFSRAASELEEARVRAEQAIADMPKGEKPISGALMKEELVVATAKTELRAGGSVRPSIESAATDGKYGNV